MQSLLLSKRTSREGILLGKRLLETKLSKTDAFTIKEMSSSPISLEEQTELAPKIPTFHEISSGGYNGRLAMAFRSASNRLSQTFEIMSNMRKHGERPSSVLAYNYMLSALLQGKRRKDAFLLLKEMEGRGMKPDLFTFEQVLFDLSKDTTLSVTVEELFHLMKEKYQIKPSSACWTFRLKAWCNKSNERRVIALFEEMKGSDPRIVGNTFLYVKILKVALERNLSLLATHLLACITPTISPSSTTLMDDDPIENDLKVIGIERINPPILLTSEDYRSILLIKHMHLAIRQIPFIRFALRQLDNEELDEGTYARILYLAARLGSSISDLAYYSLQKLSMLYRKTDQANTTLGSSNIALPRHYLEAYLECINNESSALLKSDFTAICSSKHKELAEKIETILI